MPSSRSCPKVFLYQEVKKQFYTKLFLITQAVQINKNTLRTEIFTLRLFALVKNFTMSLASKNTRKKGNAGKKAQHLFEFH